MKKKLTLFLKKLLIVISVFVIVIIGCLYGYGKSTVNNSSENDFMNNKQYVSIENISHML